MSLSNDYEDTVTNRGKCDTIYTRSASWSGGGSLSYGTEASANIGFTTTTETNSVSEERTYTVTAHDYDQFGSKNIATNATRQVSGVAYGVNTLEVDCS